jgi:adenylate kinase
MCRLLEFLRSLTIEHVLFSDLIQSERDRHTPSGHALEKAERNGVSASDEIMIAVARKWFWSRKNGCGFVLAGFPSNLAQALVFDEWLEARGETLDLVVHLVGSGVSDRDTEVVAEYFERQSILARIDSNNLNHLVQVSDAPEVAVLP